jgi:hypothetical protein
VPPALLDEAAALDEDTFACLAVCPLCHALPVLPALQRVDRFDNDIANIITNSAKRSGLTFAPEAGTQVGLAGRAARVGGW